MRIEDAMSQPVVTCPVTATAEPVIDDAVRPIGLLSMNDLARAAARGKRAAAEAALVATLATISQPRQSATRPSDAGLTLVAR